MAEIKEGYDRVTAILDFFHEPGLVDWMLKVGKTEAKAQSKLATNCGTLVDKWVKAFVKGEKLPKLTSKESENAVEGFKMFYEDYNKPVLMVAERLYDEDRKLTGEPDLYMNGMILDIKCSRQIRPKYWLQTAQYRRMFYKDSGKTAILRLDKNLADYQLEINEDCSLEQSIFDGLLSAYRYYTFNDKDIEECQQNTSF